METARYVITLWKSDTPDARVSHTIRRVADDRAVSYAQDWLRKSRRSTGIIFLYYDRWTVQTVGDNGLPRIVATGEDEENGGPPPPRFSKKGKSKREKEAEEWRARNVPIPREKTLPASNVRRPKRPRKSSPTSVTIAAHPVGLRDRLLAMKAQAKQAKQERMHNGREKNAVVEKATQPEKATAE